MKHFIIFSCFIVTTWSTYAQFAEENCKVQNFTSSDYIDDLAHPELYKELTEFTNSISSRIGIPLNIYLVECHNIENAFGDMITEGQKDYKVVIYDPEWLVGLGDKWTQKSVIAHEIGHFMAAHNMRKRGTNPEKELQADFFMGVTIKHMGGSARNVVSMFDNQPTKRSRTHPSKQERIEQATKGWQSVIKQSSNRGSEANEKTKVESKIASFTYKALLISNQGYNNDIGDLKFPNQDANKLKAILKNDYSFDEKNIFHLKDATRDDIINALDSLAGVVTKNDNLLIFYAGHGVFDENLKKGYWLPIDADSKRKTNWVSNSDIQDYLVSFKSQHTLLISDACFSGSIFEFNQRKLSDRNRKITSRLLEKKSRKAMTSGLNKPVPDESKFIQYLLKELGKNKKPYMTAGQLFSEIREAIIANTDNSPQFEVIKNANHEGGEFVFLKSN